MMNIAAFFNSWPGMFLAQSLVHTFVAALIVDTALLAWNIERPLLRQRFRLIVMIAPVVAFPCYQALSPGRGSALFRLDALFDINRWLTIDLVKSVPLAVLLLLLLAFTAVLFLFQELIPVLSHRTSSDTNGIGAARAEPDSPVAAALAGLPAPAPDVYILDDEEYAIFSATGRKPAIYLSSGLVAALEPAELRAALAHEIAHIRRSRRPLLALLFVLRILLFFNPVVLMEFRRIVQEEEKICDDEAVAMAGSREALAGAIRKFAASLPDDAAAIRLHDRIEEYSHALLLEQRISRMESEPGRSVHGALPFFLVVTTIIALNYYIV